MKTMFSINNWSYTITPVEVVKETEKTVVVREETYGGRFRENRRAKDGQFFNTPEEAKAALVQRQRKRVEEAVAALGRARAELARAEAIEIPSA